MLFDPCDTDRFAQGFMQKFLCFCNAHRLDILDTSVWLLCVAWSCGMCTPIDTKFQQFHCSNVMVTFKYVWLAAHAACIQDQVGLILTRPNAFGPRLGPPSCSACHARRGQCDSSDVCYNS